MYNGTIVHNGTIMQKKDKYKACTCKLIITVKSYQLRQNYIELLLKNLFVKYILLPNQMSLIDKKIIGFYTAF